MPSLTAWYMPSEPAGFWVLRSPSGRVWAFPNVAAAWTRGLRFEIAWTPVRESLPPTLARSVAHLLGVPGYDALTDTEAAMVAAENAYEWAILPPLPGLEHRQRADAKPAVTPAEVLRLAGLEVAP